ncbi:chain length determinant protein (polysaccharide antigen chain regulator) [Pasteurella langaaensis DSM 22999]|uniref:Chain length determinant protein (Polysaccharide antigen chain regulator) n=1 Tax=Alitibacter langaaensis DSM 22999 TaxID=1122935 RepID=A0A2U0TH65_9PAST|nr:Wzz/FepE/Etk N-terminal domain-containing protein [Pasteurella langaaensis]PVX42952.1 chain length determinant protein (polysaccharide antigen chain regulator) [Pasteurella langaaensis DSM 22999]
MTEQQLKQNDEIDLIELIQVLWKKKITIILTALVFTLAAAAYAFTAKEKWTSTAEVIPPTAVELGEYANAKMRFAKISNVSNITIDSISKKLYSNFDRIAFSQNERRDFFMKSDEYKRLIEGLDEKAQRKVLSDLSIEYISILRPDPKKNQDMFDNRISFASETPEAAQKTLTQFINFINEKAFNLDKSEFQLQITQKIESLNTEKEETETSLAVEKELNISPNSIIQSPQANMAPSQQTTGPLDHTTALLTYGADYARLQLHLIDTQLKQLTALQKEVKNLKGQSYSYQASPSYPVQRDWPKRAILLLVGAVLGGIIGSIWVLVNVFLRNNHE